MILLRPEMLFLSLMWAPLLWFAAYNLQRSAWQQVIDANLLKAFNRQAQGSARSAYATLAAVFTLITVALSGPALTHGMKTTASQGNLYVVLDNSLSMAATDVTPDRITRAKRMVFDWTRSGLFEKTSVVTYSGSAHTVTPLTSDVATLEVQLQPLSPFVMPSFGNRADLAFEQLKQTLQENTASPVHLLWITDDIEAAKIAAIKKALPPFTSATAVAVGTRAGSPIPLAQGQGNLIYQNQVVIAQTDAQAIAQRAQQLGFSVQPLGAQPQAQFFEQLNRSQQLQTGVTDIGFWLLAAILLMWLYVSKFKNIAMLAVLVLFSQTPNTSFAFNLFKNQEQQAYEQLEQNPEQALALSNNPQLQAQAQFQLQDYEAAAETLATMTDVDALYNRANALAHAGKLKQAVKLYDELLNRQEHDAARKNKKIIEDYLENQPTEISQQQGDQQQDSDQDQSSEQEQSSDNAQQQESEQGEQDDSEKNGESEQEQESKEEKIAEEKEAKEASEPEQSEESLSREDQMSESILNQLQAPSGSILQNKFKLQYQNNPTEADSTQW